jgi:hypothetical protein
MSSSSPSENSFGMRQANARAIAEEVAHEVDGWKDHFKAMDVGDRDIQALAQYLDGERLGAQRREFVSARSTHEVRPQHPRQ